MLRDTSPAISKEFDWHAKRKYDEVIRKLELARQKIDELDWHYFEHKDSLTQSEIRH